MMYDYVFLVLIFYHCSNSPGPTKFKDLDEVVKTLRNRLDGRRTLMLVKRHCVLDDVLHYMDKDTFSPTADITVSAVLG